MAPLSAVYPRRIDCRRLHLPRIHVVGSTLPAPPSSAPPSPDPSSPDPPSSDPLSPNPPSSDLCCLLHPRCLIRTIVSFEPVPSSTNPATHHHFCFPSNSIKTLTYPPMTIATLAAAIYNQNTPNQPPPLHPSPILRLAHHSPLHHQI